MGWNGGTDIFDSVARCVLSGNKRSLTNKDVAILAALRDALREADWDDESSSVYYTQPQIAELLASDEE